MTMLKWEKSRRNNSDKLFWLAGDGAPQRLEVTGDWCVSYFNDYASFHWYMRILESDRYRIVKSDTNIW